MWWLARDGLFQAERELGRDPCMPRGGTGCRNDRRPYGGMGAPPELQRRRGVNTRRFAALLVFLGGGGAQPMGMTTPRLRQPMGWNLATSSAKPSRSLIRYASVLLT